MKSFGKNIEEGTWQKLLTKADLKKLPPLYSQENNHDPMVWVKFFNPYGRGTWFAIEFDPKEELFFGYVMGLGGDELGYFSLNDMRRIRAEREQYWKPMKLSAAKAYERKLHGHTEDANSSSRAGMRAVLERLEEAKAKRIDKRSVKKALDPLGIEYDLSGSGESLTIEFGDRETGDALLKKVHKALEKAFGKGPGSWGGYKTGYGAWVLKPNYNWDKDVDDDFNAPWSRHHY